MMQTYTDEYGRQIRVYQDGEPCSRTCANHVRTICEGCGRKSARGRVEVMPFIQGSQMGEIYISASDFDALPDHTVSSPKQVPVGAKWKIISQGKFVGEKLSDKLCVLKIAVIVED